MKHPIPLHRRIFILAQWPFSSGARETWYLIRNPHNAAHLLKGIEEADKGPGVLVDFVDGRYVRRSDKSVLGDSVEE